MSTEEKIEWTTIRSYGNGCYVKARAEGLIFPLDGAELIRATDCWKITNNSRFTSPTLRCSFGLEHDSQKCAAWPTA